MTHAHCPSFLTSHSPYNSQGSGFYHHHPTNTMLEQPVPRTRHCQPKAQQQCLALSTPAFPSLVPRHHPPLRMFLPSSLAIRVLLGASFSPLTASYILIFCPAWSSSHSNLWLSKANYSFGPLSFGTFGDIWRPTTEFYWHLVGRREGCCQVPCNVRTAPHNQALPRATYQRRRG